MCGKAAASNSSARGFLEKSIWFGGLPLRLVIPQGNQNIPMCRNFLWNNAIA